ncbi:MAG: hypothetical protein IJD59_01450 [Clostridia bacterium]|nr:hypothetical protein [Clostridia bacterium]
MNETAKISAVIVFSSYPEITNEEGEQVRAADNVFAATPSLSSFESGQINPVQFNCKN